MATSTRKRTATPTLTHADAEGRVRMVDVSEKADTERIAVARGFVRVSAEARRLVRDGRVKKGDPLQAARIAGIMAAKQTSALIPLCHPLALTSADVQVELARGGIAIQARVKTTGPTGVEMEALTAVSVAALTVYDMLKAADRAMVIEQVMLVEKRGGRSGTYVARPSQQGAR
ncbi:MAG TPA: cyclic pyranopterin monophosphate synthase MoaC [Luteitalea sp.]|nr:cyclic pyranopterin monophosphate synthase MoaC [Luteitalea sp.]